MQREKENGGKDGKVYMLFVNLKAAVDKVDRKVLWNVLSKMGINE